MGDQNGHRGHDVYDRGDCDCSDMRSGRSEESHQPRIQIPIDGGADEVDRIFSGETDARGCGRIREVDDDCVVPRCPEAVTPGVNTRTPQIRGAAGERGPRAERICSSGIRCVENAHDAGLCGGIRGRLSHLPVRVHPSAVYGETSRPDDEYRHSDQNEEDRLSFFTMVCHNTIFQNTMIP